MSADIHLVRFYQEMYDQHIRWESGVTPAQLQFIAYLSYLSNINFTEEKENAK